MGFWFHQDYSAPSNIPAECHSNREAESMIVTRNHLYSKWRLTTADLVAPAPRFEMREGQIQELFQRVLLIVSEKGCFQQSHPAVPPALSKQTCERKKKNRVVQNTIQGMWQKPLNFLKASLNDDPLAVKHKPKFRQCIEHHFKRSGWKLRSKISGPQSLKPLSTNK